MDGPTAAVDFFDRVVVVNLARRPERMQGFLAHLHDWPFRPPQRFEAVDGQAVGVPVGWDKGPGAWGCLLSHRQILSQAIADGVQAIFVMEDDARPVVDFASRAPQFLAQVPDDWDGLMLGCGHLMKPEPIAPGVARCIISNRMHGYALRGRLMSVFNQMLHNTTNDHCDIVLASLMKLFKIYAPQPLLIGQDAGESDITGKVEPARFLLGPQWQEIFRITPNTPRGR